MDLGKIIRNYRELNGLSLRQFAARCNDISAGYISIIELGANPATGKPSMPSVEKLSSIAQGMGLTLDELLEKMEVKRDSPAQAQPEKPPRPTNALPYTPSRAMVAVVGSVRCGPGGALAYTDLQGAEMADVTTRQNTSTFGPWAIRWSRAYMPVT
jgi:transcriptional regulator with XRE-family HTH domain